MSVIEIELPAHEIVAGETFTATAAHRVEQCLVDLHWTATGVLELESAEGLSATFLAESAGEGRITVQNRYGNLGIADVDVVEPDNDAGAHRR